MKEQIEETEELRIVSIVLSTKDDVLLLIGAAKYKLVFGRQQSLLNNCVTLIEVDDCHTL